MRKILMSMVMFGFALAGCGGGDNSFQPSPITGPGPPPGTAASQLTVVTSAPSIPTDGSVTATITAFARDATNNLLQGVPVAFTATSGGLSGATGTTDASGAATVTLSTAGDSSARTITVTATSGSLTATVNVQVAAGGTQTSVSMGSPAGAGFVAGALGISNANLSAGGSTTIQAVLQQSDGSLYTQSADVTFSSPCVAQGLATITSPVTTASGIASANYVATGCSGADVITATAAIGGAPLSANGTVTVAAGAIGSIVFISATPENIALRGTGTSSNPETSTVVFRVLEQGGGPRAGATVNFSLNTSVGGISVSPASAVSGTDGSVQTVVQGGTVATTVRVTATVQNVTPAISTQSNQLTVTTGIPDQDSFSLAVSCANVEAWTRDGETIGVTARLSDRFNNPVPDDTAVTLQTEGGSIVSQCLTTGGLGRCSVNWTGSNPRPGPHANGDIRAGRATILATAIGEESFTDTNGNGSFDVGENFADMAERFLDENENGTRDPTEPIYDFNNNSVYDAGDGDFNGVLCLDPARCGTQATTGISADNVIVMSGSTPDNVSPQPTITAGTVLTVPLGGSARYTFVMADVNDNPMPAGTTVAFTIGGTGLTVTNPAGSPVACTREPTLAAVTINAANPASPGTLSITVRSPSGVATLLEYDVDVIP